MELGDFNIKERIHLCSAQCAATVGSMNPTICGDGGRDGNMEHSPRGDERFFFSTVRPYIHMHGQVDEPCR